METISSTETIKPSRKILLSDSTNKPFPILLESSEKVRAEPSPNTKKVCKVKCSTSNFPFENLEGCLHYGLDIFSSSLCKYPANTNGLLRLGMSQTFVEPEFISNLEV